MYADKIQSEEIMEERTFILQKNKISKYQLKKKGKTYVSKIIKHF